MITLLDVNVLVAIAWPEHAFHHLAVEWFDRRADEGWATCPLTETGFLRISANAKVVGNPVRPQETAALLTELRHVGAHHFWIDDIEVTSSLFPLKRLVGHRQVADAHLLAISRRNKGSFSTFDRGLVPLARGLIGAHVELIGGGSAPVAADY